MACLQYAHENGCPWDEETCTAAAEYGHLGCLQYAHENGCPWDEYIAIWAIEGDHFECVEYLQKHGGFCTATIMSYAHQYGSEKLKEYIKQWNC